jgi:hypothetical protein
VFGVTAATVLAVAGSSSAPQRPGPAAAPAQFHRCYFDQPRPLALDPDRIAIYRAVDGAGDPFGRVEPAAARVGIGAEALAPGPVAGWVLATTPGFARNPPGIETLAGDLALQQEIDFVSPVFVGEDGGPLIVTPQLLVGFRRDVPPARAEALLAAVRAGAIARRDFGNMKGVYQLRSAARNGLDVLEAANALAALPEVAFAEPDMMFTGHGAVIPDDPGFPDLWGIHNTGQAGGVPDVDMDGPEAWDLTSGDDTVIVVVIDTGVQQDHPDIHQIPGTDTTNDPASTGDGGPVNVCDNHGTLVAGCASAIMNNTTGTAGIAPGCVVASARTFISNLSCNLSWTTQISWTVESLAWAESIGARVTNNSNFYGFTSSAIAQKYQDTRSAGIVHFAAAGNFGSSAPTYPASLPSVNAIAAIDRDGDLAPFSNHGAGLAFSAPGVDIYTTDRTGALGVDPGDYTWTFGTSYACPYAAGVGALVVSTNGCLDADEVEQVMREASVDLGSPGFDTTFGWGLVNAHASVLLTPLSPDFDESGTIDGGDVVLLLSVWGLSDPTVDLNDDGIVNVLDLIELLLVFGEACE